jgi:hypothetical protein
MLSVLQSLAYHNVNGSGGLDSWVGRSQFWRELKKNVKAQVTAGLGEYEYWNTQAPQKTSVQAKVLEYIPLSDRILAGKTLKSAACSTLSLTHPMPLYQNLLANAGEYKMSGACLILHPSSARCPNWLSSIVKLGSL